MDNVMGKIQNIVRKNTVSVNRYQIKDQVRKVCQVACSMARNIRAKMRGM